jgi:hypothetical protein
MVSPDVNVPVGMLKVMVVELGLVNTTAVAPLRAPVMVLPITRLVDAPTVAVMVPTGYWEIPDTMVWLTCSMVHRFSPRLAQSANRKFIDRRAVTAS